MPNVFAYPPPDQPYTRTVVGGGRVYEGVAHQASVFIQGQDTAELTAAGWTFAGPTTLDQTQVYGGGLNAADASTIEAEDHRSTLLSLPHEG